MTIRAPHFSKPRALPRQQPAVVPNLLVTTLAVVAAPFVPVEQAVSRALEVQQPQQLGSPYALIGNAGEKPFALTDWPTPPARPTQPAANFNSPLALLFEEKPFAQTDWPNPFVPSGQPPGQIPISIALTFEEQPFSQTDWPNPQIEVPQQPFQRGSWVAVYEEAGEKPFLQSDWITPPAIKIQQPVQVGSLLPHFGTEEKPFHQDDWPNPQVELTQEPRQGPIPLPLAEAPVQPPFFQTDWPNPTLARKVQTPFQVGSPIALIGEAGERPFFQTDWPNPEFQFFLNQPQSIQGRSPIGLLATPPPPAQPFSGRHMAKFIN